MKTVKLGIFGLGRGGSFIDNILLCGGEIVAVCDRDESKLGKAREKLGDGLATYTDFDAFLGHDGMEAVFLCNFFHEHASYAIRALEKNLHVLSECTSNATMADGVALVRAAEKSRGFYMLAENYPFMKFNREMYRVYRGGTLGKALYAEGEYNHPVNPADVKYQGSLRPFPTHWRNYTPRTYYVTHSLAPLMYVTGATPKRVTALPVSVEGVTEDALFGPAVEDRAAVILTQNDDGSVFRVTGCAGFGAHGNSYRFACDRGQIENVRGAGGKVMLRYNKWNIPEGAAETSFYMPDWNDPDAELIERSGHGGGDFLVIREFFRCIRENVRPVFDEYFATAMASVAILSHRSLLAGGVPYDIPDLRTDAARKAYENDRETPFYGSDGSEPTLPCTSRG